MIPTQLIPVLTILNDDGDFTVRIGEEAWAASLGQKVVSLIADLGVAKKLTILTPADTKVFKFDAPARAPRPAISPAKASQRISQDTSAPPSPELVGEYEEELRRQEQEEAELRKVERENAIPIDSAQEDEPVAPRRRGRPSKVDNALKAATSCGRCGGDGTIAGGGVCPVCQGKGSITHYGAR